MVSQSRVTWATYVSILVFLALCSRLRPDVYATDGQDRQDVRQHHRLMPPPIRAETSQDKTHSNAV